MGLPGIGQKKKINFILVIFFNFRGNVKINSTDFIVNYL